MTCPCNLCEDRFVGCHSACDAYNAWKAAQKRLMDMSGRRKAAVMNEWQRGEDLRWQRRKRGHR